MKGGEDDKPAAQNAAPSQVADKSTVDVEVKEKSNS
jgi:sec-independent protein translocase protein TatA